MAIAPPLLLVIILLVIVGVTVKSPAVAAGIVLAATVAYLFLPDPEAPCLERALEGSAASYPLPEILTESKEEDVSDGGMTQPELPARVKPVAAALPGESAVGANEALPETRVQKAQEEAWLGESEMSVDDTQRAERDVHRALRRNTLWSTTSKWTPEDKHRYETMRRRVESKIASALRPDGNMVVEDDPEEDKTHRSDQPFAAVTSQDQALFHSAGFLRMGATGNMASLLRNKF